MLAFFAALCLAAAGIQLKPSAEAGFTEFIRSREQVSTGTGVHFEYSNQKGAFNGTNVEWSSAVSSAGPLTSCSWASSGIKGDSVFEVKDKLLNALQTTEGATPLGSDNTCNLIPVTTLPKKMTDPRQLRLYSSIVFTIFMHLFLRWKI